MEFLVEFDVHVPVHAAAAEVEEHERAESVAAAELVAEGCLVRLWRPRDRSGDTSALGLYRAADEAELNGVIDALPLREWMGVTVTPLEPHPNDPGADRQRLDGRAEPEAGDEEPGAAELDGHGGGRVGLPGPRLEKIYRLEATLGDVVDVGDVERGRRRIVPLTGGSFSGPELNGTLLAGASADWQIVLDDGTAIGDVRYTLQTDGGDVLYVRSRGVRHGSAEVLARLGRGEDVDPGEYTFRTTTRIETASAGLDWLNKGVFVGVGGRQPGGVVYEVYLVA